MDRSKIYAIRDRVADLIVGGLHVHKHDAAAIRMFSDVLTMPGSVFQTHSADFDLIQVAEMDDQGNLYGGGDKQICPAVILTGTAWAAAQQPQGDTNAPA